MGTLVQEGTPEVEAAASAELTISGPVSDGETVTIGDIILEFDADASITEPNIAVDISGGTKAQATGSVVFEAGAAEGDTLAIGDDVYEIDVEGDGVELGNIQVDVSTQYAAATATLTLDTL